MRKFLILALLCICPLVMANDIIIKTGSKNFIFLGNQIFWNMPMKIDPFIDAGNVCKVEIFTLSDSGNSFRSAGVISTGFITGDLDVCIDHVGSELLKPLPTTP